MDSERFDGMVRALGHGASRRGALGLLAGVVGLGLENVAAKGKRRRHDRRPVKAQRGPQCRAVGANCQGDDNPGKGNKCCSGLVCSNTGPGAGTCQPNTPPPPHVCAGKDAPNPCFPNSAPACGTSGTGRTCHCGTDVTGNLACYDLGYCINPTSETHCVSNADCVAKGFGEGSVCFSAENCCPGGTDATGRSGYSACATPCPLPAA